MPPNEIVRWVFHWRNIMRKTFAFLSLAVLSVTSLLPVSTAAADQAPPYIQHVWGIPSVINCNGRVVHIRDVSESPCNYLLAPGTQSTKSAVATGQALPLTQSVVDPILLGTKMLTVCDGEWVTPDLNRGTFPCKQWRVNISNGQIYAAYQLYPEVAVYSGNVIDSCGSSSAALLAIETPTPEIAVLSIRLNVCDASASPPSYVPQLYYEAQCQLYTGDHSRMSGVINSTLFDNRLLDGHPESIEMFHASCDLGPA
jgi:hypothetical protein